VRIILASASPRRAELLAAAGFVFEVRPVDVDESPRAGESAEDYVRRVASAKSAAAQRLEEPAARGRTATIGADTAVVVDGAILGKPAGDDEAAAMLRRLSGRTHEVLTGLSVRVGDREETRVERTLVEFAELGNRDVQWHVQSGEGMDKAGAYAIQGLASRFIPRIVGSYSNVVGLPVAAVAQMIEALAAASADLASRG
jgi:septum formation protein